MRGGYDLYGRYYPNIDDAINAEMAQCAAIDLAHTRQEMGTLQKQRSSLEQRIEALERRVKQLEEQRRNEDYDNT